MSALKFIGPPGSLGFLAVCLALAGIVAYISPSRRRGARWCCAGVAFLYIVLSLPVVAALVSSRLPPITAPKFTSARAGMLIVLDGDNRRGRIREALAIYRIGAPPIVWVLGSPWLREHLVEAGISSEQMSFDPNQGTTRAQMERVAGLVASTRGQVVLVASRLQMPRIDRLARPYRDNLILAPAPADAEPKNGGLAAWLPHFSALRISRDGIYEHAALAYYRRRGWIGPD